MDVMSATEARTMSRSFADQHEMDCICSICNCGKCSCPPDIVQGRYGNIRSEHQAQFTGEFVPATRTTKTSMVHQSRPFEGTTTHQDDFAFFSGQGRRKPSTVAKGSSGIFDTHEPFQGSTTNKHDFKNWNVAPAAIMKPKQDLSTISDDRMFQTENSSQFGYKPQARRASCAPVQKVVGTEVFEGISTQRADFVKHNAKPAKSIARMRKFRPREEDRMFTTEARENFQQYEIEFCPAVQMKKSYNTRKTAPGHVYVEPLHNGTYRPAQF